MGLCAGRMGCAPERERLCGESNAQDGDATLQGVRVCDGLLQS
jgi:hypothetical protein